MSVKNAKYVYVHHSKMGPDVYDSALACLKSLVQWGMYEGEVQDRAKNAMSRGERASWQWLESRKDHEYERVSRELLRTA